MDALKASYRLNMPTQILKKMAAVGGKRSKAKADPATPLPRKDMVVIFVMHLSQGFQVTMLFPLIVFMVTDFGVANHNPHLIGRYAGFLASLYPFAQFCTSMLWGFVSDKVGRKPVLISGNIVASVSALLFGLSGNYGMACLVRFFGGLLNGVITVTKSTLSELCDKTNQRQGFAVLSLGWGIGAIAGQVIGGVAAQPCQQYNIRNCPKVLETHPFILPCVGAAFFSAVAAVAVCFLQETLNGATNGSEETIELVNASERTVEVEAKNDLDEKSGVVGGFVAGLGSSQEHDEESALLMKPIEKEELLTMLDPKLEQEEDRGFQSEAVTRGLQEEGLRGQRNVQDESNLETAGIDTGVLQLEEQAAAGVALGGSEFIGEGANSSGPNRIEGSGDARKQIGWGWGRPRGAEYDKLHDLEAGSQKIVHQPGQKDRFYLRDPDVWIASGTFAMTAFIHIAADELFPIFSAAPIASGGLGYSAFSIGILGGLCGAVLFLFTILFLKINPSSSRFCYTLGSILALPVFILMPLTSLLPNMLTLQWWLVALLLTLKQIAGCMGFTGAMVLVSNSSDSSNMGAVTGFSHSLGAFARAAGPFLGGSLWSFSVALRVPFSQFIPWEIIMVLTLATLGLAALAKPYLDAPKSERASYRHARPEILSS